MRCCCVSAYGNAWASPSIAVMDPDLLTPACVEPAGPAGAVVR